MFGFSILSEPREKLSKFDVENADDIFLEFFKYFFRDNHFFYYGKSFGDPIPNGLIKQILEISAPKKYYF